MNAQRFDVSQHAYAHRGLWTAAGSSGAVVENSLTAFRSAVAAGVGVELDVRQTHDGALVVFHDATLTRLCNEDVRLDALTLSELRERRLPDGSSIPLLETVLDAMGDQPVLIELKIDAPGGDLADRVAAMLDRLPVRAAAMSFDEPAVARLRDRITDRPVGQLIEPEPYIGRDAVLATTARAIAIGCDYLAPNILSLATVAAVADGRPLVSWTIGDPALLDLTRQHAAGPIFERFDPELAKRR